MAKPVAQSLLCLDPRPEARLRLVMFPYAGGGTVVYRSWVGSIPAAIEPWAMLLPGRESRMAEEPLHSLEELVRIATDELIPLLELPCAVFGHSMGATAAFEVCRELRRRQASLPVRLIVSGRRAPDLESQRKPLHLLPEPELIEELRRFNGTPEAILKDRSLMELMLPVIRADLEVIETYRYQVEPPIEVPLSVYGGDADPDVSLEELEGWAQHTSAACDLTLVSGDHFFLLEGYRELLAAVSRKVLPEGG